MPCTVINLVESLCDAPDNTRKCCSDFGVMFHVTEQHMEPIRNETEYPTEHLCFASFPKIYLSFDSHVSHIWNEGIQTYSFASLVIPLSKAVVAPWLK